MVIPSWLNRDNLNLLYLVGGFLGGFSTFSTMLLYLSARRKNKPILAVSLAFGPRHGKGPIVPDYTSQIPNLVGGIHVVNIGTRPINLKGMLFRGRGQDRLITDSRLPFPHLLTESENIFIPFVTEEIFEAIKEADEVQVVTNSNMKWKLPSADMQRIKNDPSFYLPYA